MKIAICDDCAEDRAALHAWLDRYCLAHNYSCAIAEAESGEQLSAFADIADYDAIFMDIFLKKQNGLETAEALKALGYTGAYIFTTSSAEYVFQSFAFDVVDYLVKPFPYPRFAQAADKLFKAKADARLTIPLDIDGETRQIQLNRIYSVETDSGHGTLIHMSTSTLRSTTTISEIESLLSPYRNFFRCHRSYIVNLNYVSGVKDAAVYLKNGGTALLPRREAAEKRRQINEYLWQHMMEE